MAPRRGNVVQVEELEGTMFGRTLATVKPDAAHAGFKLVTRLEKTLRRVLRGTSDADINFSDLRGLLTHLGFDERIRGGHHIFTQPNVKEILNLQPRGAKAKPYQVKQVRQVILRYKLEEVFDAETE